MQTSTESDDPRMAALSDAEELIDRLQAEAESHRATLARAIHDDLGGLMVSAAMDFTSVGQHLIELTPPIRRQLDRGRETLESAIDMSRRMVEELRPVVGDRKARDSGDTRGLTAGGRVGDFGFSLVF
jgi:signal transduction histidine kinase